PLEQPLGAYRQRLQRYQLPFEVGKIFHVISHLGTLSRGGGNTDVLRACCCGRRRRLMSLRDTFWSGRLISCRLPPFSPSALPPRTADRRLGIRFGFSRNGISLTGAGTSDTVEPVLAADSAIGGVRFRISAFLLPPKSFCWNLSSVHV
ncbi:unnamed protein product, partial [Ectocarpus sp. 12 AP-2014]